MMVKLLTDHLEFLILKECCRGSSKPTIVKMSNCWKSHAVAHLQVPYVSDVSTSQYNDLTSQAPLGK